MARRIGDPNVVDALRVLVGMKLHRSLTALVPLALVAALTGCVVPVGPGGQPVDRDPLVMPVPDDQQVWALLTVIDDGSGAELCPIVLESYPPQCGGPIPIDGWVWDDLPFDQEGDVRFGFYAVYGSYDGERFTVTLPAEFGGAIDVKPLPSEGTLTAEEMARIVREIQEDLLGEYGIAEGDGIVTLDVTWDDGSLQRQLDERYGKDAVVVNSVFRPFDLS